MLAVAFAKLVITGSDMSAIQKMCVGVLAVLSASAMAGGQSSASVRDLSFSLIDLDSADGVEAAYSLVPNPQLGSLSYVSATASDDSASENGFQKNLNSAPSVFEPIVVNAYAGGGYASAAIDANGVSASGAFSASGPTATYQADAATGGNQTYDLPGGLWNINLTAHSVLFVSVKAAASAWAGNLSCSTGTEDNDFGFGCGPERAAAIASMQLSYTYKDSLSTASYNYYDAVRAQADVASHYGGFHTSPGGQYRTLLSVDVDEGQDNSRTLTAVFANTTDLPQQATLVLRASVFGNGTSPIPEPTTASMYGLGLIALCSLVCLRKSHQA